MLKGQVTVDDGLGQSCVINLPSTACSISTFTAGAVTLSAQYTGDTNNLPSADTSMHTVTQAVTNLSISAAPNPVLIGADVALMAIISDGVDPITGTVDFTVDGNLIPTCTGLAVVNGGANCVTQFDQPIPLLIGATYSGDGNNLSAVAELGIIVQPLPIPTLNRWALLLLIFALLLIGIPQARRRQASH